MVMTRSCDEMHPLNPSSPRRSRSDHATYQVEDRIGCFPFLSESGSRALASVHDCAGEERPTVYESKASAGCHALSDPLSEVGRSGLRHLPLPHAPTTNRSPCRIWHLPLAPY